MNFYSITEEDIHKLEKEYEKSKKELKSVESTTINKMWENDLT